MEDGDMRQMLLIDKGGGRRRGYCVEHRRILGEGEKCAKCEEWSRVQRSYVKRLLVEAERLKRRIV